MGSKDNFQWLDSTGSSEYNITDNQAYADATMKKISKFLIDVQKAARKYNLIGKGNLVSQKGYRVNRTDQDNITIIEIFMINYGMFQNKGVKGVDSISNAPNSPYQFKTYGMPKSAIDGIAASIRSGKRMTRNVKSKKVGLEKKSKSETDSVMSEAKRIAYMIKKYGIKTKPFFTEAFEKSFGKLTNDEIVAFKKQLVATIVKQNRK